jgi:ATP-dependent Zn protease
MTEDAIVEEITVRMREDTAYHEAAHVVANLSVGIRFVEVNIVPDDDNETSGAVLLEEITADDWYSMELDEVRDGIFIRLVAATMDKLRGCFSEIAVSADYEQAIDFAFQFYNYQEILDEQWTRAEQFVSNPEQMARIELVANALLEQGTLTYKQVMDLLER